MTTTCTWISICRREQILPDTGVAALVDGTQIAIFHLADGRLFAVGNRCPYSGANVISRGLIGSAGDTVFVASPIYKQRFDLATGLALDDRSVSLGTWPVRCCNGMVEIAVS